MSRHRVDISDILEQIAADKGLDGVDALHVDQADVDLDAGELVVDAVPAWTRAD